MISFHKKYCKSYLLTLFCLFCLLLSTCLLQLCTFFEQTLWSSFCWMYGPIKDNSHWEVEFCFQKNNRFALRVIFYKTYLDCFFGFKEWNQLCTCIRFLSIPKLFLACLEITLCEMVKNIYFAHRTSKTI